MTNIKSLTDITNNGLCIGCGLCQSILGKEKISIEMTDKGRLEPKEINPISGDDLERVKKICPGVIVEGLPKKDISNDSKFDTLWGYYNSLFYAWSTDEQIRFQSSTGGLLNGLSLFLLESKKVDFILHTAGDPEKPMRSIPRFSYTKQELLS
ncbi:MAG: hydrogenase, partial [Proteobacteria bacterium]|nr:hydrogenase [Pseudomonadota bacterium]